MTRSTSAAVRRASPKMRFHWLNSRLDVMIKLFRSYQSVMRWNRSSADSFVRGMYPISSKMIRSADSRREWKLLSFPSLQALLSCSTSSETRKNLTS